ncbi:antibiotic biosynthesis monooxygenase family protein [Sporosarcina jiandibaonis]|uniref:antibiotic biosynthesis monooxygenase family protein n=1 Tax=Sporosarcina jiandibaonis TaxID=2715535 RepID=UPI00155489AC|nr:antibiotic biosynthesis monooxygenase [Sporosarcina jiandibaonis]
MNIFLTSGTMGFMETVRKRYANEMMIVMHGAGNSVLLHETEGKTVFQTPRRYEVISSSGKLTEEGFFAFNNIPITDEGRPIFEHRFQSRIEAIAGEPGFVAYRLLRPLNSETYIILSQWTSKEFLNLWLDSPAYKKMNDSIENEVGLDKMQHIFLSAPYVTTYKTKVEKEQNGEDYSN